MDKGLALFLPALALSLKATEPIIVARSSIPAYILGNFFQFSTQPPTSGKLALTQKKQEINAAGQLLHNLPHGRVLPLTFLIQWASSRTLRIHLLRKSGLCDRWQRHHHRIFAKAWPLYLQSFGVQRTADKEVMARVTLCSFELPHGNHLADINHPSYKYHLHHNCSRHIQFFETQHHSDTQTLPLRSI